MWKILEHYFTLFLSSCYLTVTHIFHSYVLYCDFYVFKTNFYSSCSTYSLYVRKTYCTVEIFIHFLFNVCIKFFRVSFRFFIVSCLVVYFLLRAVVLLLRVFDISQVSYLCFTSFNDWNSSSCSFFFFFRFQINIDKDDDCFQILFKWFMVTYEDIQTLITQQMIYHYSVSKLNCKNLNSLSQLLLLLFGDISLSPSAVH